MFLIIGKILEEKIDCFIEHIEDFVSRVDKFIKQNEEWRKHMSDASKQLLDAVDNLTTSQSAFHTSLGEYFAEVDILIGLVKGTDNADIQSALDKIKAAAAVVNSDGDNLKAHQQTAADAAGQPAPAEPVPTAPSTGDGSTPPADGGSAPTDGSTPPEDGSTAPEGGEPAPADGSGETTTEEPTVPSDEQPSV